MISVYAPAILITLCIVLNTSAQVLMKVGMDRIGVFEFSFHNLIPITLRVMQNFYIIGALTCYVLSVLLWLLVLSRVEVGYAYPLSSLGYVLTAVVGFVILGESLSLLRIMGILIIMVGVYLVARS